MTLTIGLTGGIATGKSTVSSMIANFDIPIIDADKIAREVVEPGRTAYMEIIQKFGSEILKKDETLNRKRLGEIIFSNKEKRDQLNNIVHPAVRKEMLQQRDYFVNLGVNSVVLDIPLLFESNLMNYVEKTIVVYIPEKLQLKRLMKRDYLTKNEALKRIRSQMPTSDKIKLADVVIDNSQTKEKTLQQLVNILNNWNAI